MYTRSNGEDEVLNVALLQELGEERRPVGLNLDVGRLHDRGDLLGLQEEPSRNHSTAQKTLRLKEPTAREKNAR